MKYNELIAEAYQTFYHGSNQPISEFSLDFIGRAEAIDQEGPGIYLTSSAQDAMKYGKHVHIVKVKVVKSRLMPERRTLNSEFIRGLIYKSPNRDDVLQNWDENPQRALVAATRSIMDSYGPNEYREALEQIWADFYRGHEKQWLSRMRSLGWDGFLLDRQDGVKHLISFVPENLTIEGEIS